MYFSKKKEVQKGALGINVKISKSTDSFWAFMIIDGIESATFCFIIGEYS